MESTTKVVKEFHKEVEEMKENDPRLKTIEEWKKKIEMVSEIIPNHVWKEC